MKNPYGNRSITKKTYLDWWMRLLNNVNDEKRNFKNFLSSKRSLLQQLKKQKLEDLKTARLLCKAHGVEV